ncbi:MAG: hypothetical protein CVT63_06415, partial [Candidatus Anoxymicrobium japonicum]
ERSTKMKTSRIALAAVLVAALLSATLICAGCGVKHVVKKPVSEDTAQSSAQTGGKPVVIFLTQPGCPPCKVAMSLVKELIDEMGGQLTYREIDISEDSASASKYGAQYTPTIVVTDSSGNEVGKLVGVPDRAELRALFEKAIAK